MLSAASSLLIRQHDEALVRRIAGESSGQIVGAIELVEHQDAPAKAVSIEVPFFARGHHGW
jgi:hypothetical protein